MRFQTLDQWLHWQETLNPKKIDLTLDRVKAVLTSMGLAKPPYTVITVAGTNGKGSCVALLSAMLRAGGYKVGAYTSPHILRYNERVMVAGVTVSDEVLCESFERIDQARGDTPLTYFEFGTLAAIDIFAQSQVDVAILEVGLGGRLDATNAVDTDAALIASISIDHVSWLGDNRELIGFEKAGVLRADRPAICGDFDPPMSVRRVAEELGAQWWGANEQFGYRKELDSWTWWSSDEHGKAKQRNTLPFPALRGEVQLANASASIAVLESLADYFPLSQSDIRAGLQGVNLPARFQVVPAPVARIYDVAHNPAAALELAKRLDSLPSSGKTFAVTSIFADKDIAGVMAPLLDKIDAWHIFALDAERAASLDTLSTVLLESGARQLDSHDSAADAWQAVLAEAVEGDRIVVFGSFYTVAAIMPLDDALE
ncbi:MAG: bifunctional tetrahydrofolate synthase/dihydrofolate synthase [Thiotrichales bacterium]|nr:bifunctional tetrahydrofolate synthase/dihydrofolate synthase [Thiotrichales bacterium]